MAFDDNGSERRWFVMRDLKRRNARYPAYRQLGEIGMELFVPMKEHISAHDGKREEIPFMQDLLFVHETRLNLDPVVERTPTLQYRWLRGTWREPMTVADADMSRFINAVRASGSTKYYLPEEITPAMHGRKIRIVGGPLDGYEGSLVTTRGSKVRRLLVELKGFLAAGVEIEPEYIQFVKE